MNEILDFVFQEHIYFEIIYDSFTSIFLDGLLCFT